MQIQNPMNLTLPSCLYGGGLVLPYQNHAPMIGNDVYIAATATVIGQTTLGNHVSIWFGAVLRGDIAAVQVGDGSNIQDLSVLHVGSHDPCMVGKNVVVGHRVILHGCSVEDDCLIGMGAIVLNRAVIGQGSVVGAGALITEGMSIPPYSLVIGMPAKVIRELKPEEKDKYSVFASKYVGVAHNYR